jgi:uncharacterized protein (TIGR03067 family)
MKRFAVLLLVLGLIAGAVGAYEGDKDKDKDKDKKVEKDKAEKKADKDKDKADKDKDKDKGKAEADKGKAKPISEEAKKELEKLSGTFTVTLFERDGTKEPDAELKKMRVVQKGAVWSFFLGSEVTEGVDTVHPDKTPKQIDSLYTNSPEKGKTVLGIYEISGDTIKYCWAETGKERPKEFATKAGSGLTLMILKRSKEAPPPPPDKGKEKKEEKKEEKKKEEKKEEKDKGKEKKEEKKKEEKKDKGKS